MPQLSRRYRPSWKPPQPIRLASVVTTCLDRMVPIHPVSETMVLASGTRVTSTLYVP